MSSKNNRLIVYYVYLITNNLNKKTYVGKRKIRCKYTTPETDKYMGSGVALKYAKEKYGLENFSKDILAVCHLHKICKILEKSYIELYRSIGKAEYNIANGGEGGHGPTSEETKIKLRLANLGKKRSLETRKKLSEFHKHRSKEVRDKISKSLRGRKYGSRSDVWKSNISKGIRNSEKWRKAIQSEERSRKLSESLKGKKSWNKGMKMGDEFSKRVSTSMKQMYVSPKGDEVKAKIKFARQFQVMTEETKRKISESNKGKKVSDATREKLSKANAGRVVSEETKLKIKAARARQVFSEESREKLKESKRKYWDSPEGFEMRRRISEQSRNRKMPKGLHWYNNGEVSIKAVECPDGFVPGRLGNFACSEEVKRKKSEAYWSKSAEEKVAWKAKLSNSHKGAVFTQERRDKIKASKVGIHYWNNGIVEVMRRDCPEGFVPGRLARK